MMMLGRKKAADEKATEKEVEKGMQGPAGLPSAVEAFKPEQEEEEEVWEEFLWLVAVLILDYKFKAAKVSDAKPSSSDIVEKAVAVEEASSSSRVYEMEEKKVDSKTAEENSPKTPTAASEPHSSTPNRSTTSSDPTPAKTKQQIVHEIVHGDEDERLNFSRRSLSEDGNEEEEGAVPKKKRRTRIRTNRPVVNAGDDYGIG